MTDVPDTPTPLGEEQIEHYRALLQEKRKEIAGDYAQLEQEADRLGGVSGGGSTSNAPTHPADEATDNYEWNLAEGLAESERALLTAIDEALTRMDAGSYGICRHCGKRISEERLEAKPWSQYCVDSAKDLESG